MRLNERAIALSDIIIDAGTQVRVGGVDEAWVKELQELYQDGVEIPPIVVVIERIQKPDLSYVDGPARLVEGFHRYEAQKRNGETTARVIVKSGDIHDARMIAASVNKNGLPRQPGDKRKAVEMARDAAKAKGVTMGPTELAKHCGVTRQYVYDVLNGGDSPRKVVDNDSKNFPTAIADRPALLALYQRIEGALRANPNRTDTEIANEIGCDRAVVGRRRKAAGYPKAKFHQPNTPRAAALLAQHPDWPNKRIAEESGSTPKTVSDLRKGQRVVTEPPSAPARKGGDVRDRVDVIAAHPAAAPEVSEAAPVPVAPPKPGFSGAIARDTVESIVRHIVAARDEMRRAWDAPAVMGPDWALLVERITVPLGQIGDLSYRDKA